MLAGGGSAGSGSAGDAALSGAATGAAVGGPWGAAIGAGLGLASSAASGGATPAGDTGPQISNPYNRAFIATGNKSFNFGGIMAPYEGSPSNGGFGTTASRFIADLGNSALEPFTGEKAKGNTGLMVGAVLAAGAVYWFFIRKK